MTLLHSMQPKDALVLCTVTVLFIYFGIILWTNYAIIIPFWTPIFWATALSVPLHALKSRLLPPLHNALENDLMDTIASAIGGVVTYILRFFVGSHIANAVKSVFLGYCYVVYMLCDGRPRDNMGKKTTAPTKDESCANGNVDHEEDFSEERQLNRIDDDDYELHPDYQTLVDQEQDGYARPANWPSYTNLLRAAFIYVLLQVGTPSELWSGVKTIWSEIEFGTQQQFNILIVAFMFHIQYSCLGRIVAVIERVIYPKLTPDQYKERSIINTVPKMFRKALQESLNSTLTTTIVLSTIAVVGTLVAILSIGVAHDVQGLLAQTHHRVMGFREEQAQWTLENAQDAGVPPVPKSALVSQVDDALSQAYDTGLQWFDPILKDAFPDLTWGATEWAFQLAHVVVDLDHFQNAAAAAKAAAQASAAAAQASAAAAQASAADAKAKATCEAPEEKKVDLNELLLHPADQTTLSSLDFASTRADKEEHDNHNDNNDNNDNNDHNDNNDNNDNNDINDTNEIHDHMTLEEPELWPIPTLQSLLLSGSDNKAAFGTLSNSDINNTPRQKAINISQAKYLLSIIFGYKGLDTPMMLWGFNVFNDLLFRGILFMLVLMTFTGLKVSPLQRLGWIIDQALSSSATFGSFHLSDTYSPGRVLAKSLEFSISGTFISMFKLSIYHTLFTLAWTHFLTDRVTLLVATGEASPDFVPIKYAWLTSLFGIILTLFPIAPNWLVAIPGGLVHFYIYGQRSMEAVAMVVGHFLLANLVDSAVWDSHVVKNARPGVSSAFWLGLWVFLGGMKWGPKGLLLGPVFFAAVPSIWSALLELRGKPSRGLTTRLRYARSSTTGMAADQASLKDSKRHGSTGTTSRKGYRQEFYGEYEREEEENDSRRSSRSNSVSSSKNSRGRTPRGVNGYRRDEKSAISTHR